MTQKLSVIVPVYNCEKYLPACLDSILSQTYEPLEIILVDDGSTDRSGKICDDYAAKDTRIKVIHKPNGGQVSARREGLSACSCEYVAFVDADDAILPDMYTFLMSELGAHQVDIITSGFNIYRDEEMTAELTREHDHAKEGIYRGEDLQALLTSAFVSPDDGADYLMQTLCTKIYRKDLLLKYIADIPSGLRAWEDLSYSLPPFSDAACVQITHQCFYKYRPNPTSTTHTLKQDLAFTNALHSMAAAEKNYMLCTAPLLSAFYRKAAHIFYMALWKDHGESLSIDDLKKAAASNFFQRVVHAVALENKMKNKRVLRFLTPIAKGRIRLAICYCLFSRFLTKCHVTWMKLGKRNP